MSISRIVVWQASTSVSWFWCHVKPSVQWINLKWLLNACSEGSEMWRAVPKTSLPDSVYSQWMFRGLTWSENRPCSTLDWLPANCPRMDLIHWEPIHIRWTEEKKNQAKAKRLKVCHSKTPSHYITSSGCLDWYCVSKNKTKKKKTAFGMILLVWNCASPVYQKGAFKIQSENFMPAACTDHWLQVS